MNKRDSVKWGSSVGKRVWIFIAVMGLAFTAAAGERHCAVRAFDGSGRLTFNELATATVYRVEWANAPTGAWHTGTPGVTAIKACCIGQCVTTVSVAQAACFYRVIASVTNVPPGMALIPDGSFVMGATTNLGHESNVQELPQHTVFVSAFCIDKYEVTKALWDNVRTSAVTVANGYSDLSVGDGKASNHPVQNVDWYDMVKWCNARSQKEGRTPCYTNANGSVYKTGTFAGGCNWKASGYRLPTEAEWEKAARGGAANHRFPWTDGDAIQHARANYKSDASLMYDTSPTRGTHPDYTVAPGTTYTSPVGSFAPNGYGLYDMAGNVWEWCWDFYLDTYYSSSPGVDPRGPATGTGTRRVWRGGGWDSLAGGSRTAYRSYMGNMKMTNLGFRTVTLPGQ
jgi:formylglycine-generating enzyme required for sulfatase activity